MHKKFKAFTLVELIVVITILAILWTIWFVSLQGYSVNARDSVRIADTKTYIKALNIYQTKNGEVPLPDDMTTITGSGVVFSYQGTLSWSVVTELKQGQVPVDPLLKTPYLYATNEGRTKVQLLSYHEKNTSSLELQNTLTYAETTYADMFPKVIGDEIGILLQADNTRVGSGTLSLADVTQSLKYISNNQESIIGSGAALLEANPLNSCKRILESGMSHGSDYYTIYPNGEWRKTFCDMETDGGGWTAIARTASGAASGNFGWTVTRWEIDDTSDAFSFWSGVGSINFEDLLIVRSDNGKDYDLALKLGINPDDFMSPNLLNAAKFIEVDQREVISTEWLPEEEKSYNHQLMFYYWWYFSWTDTFYFRDNHYAASFWVRADYIHSYEYSPTYGSFWGKQWYIFVR